MPPRGGLQPLGNFTTGLRLPDGFDKRPDATGSANVQAAIAWMAEKRPPKQNHWPALVLALIAQSEALLQAEHLDNLTDVFAAHPVEVSSDGRVVNTLNFTRAGEQSIQLRPIYNAVLSVIRNDMLRQHPKNEAHATQSWPAYRELATRISAMTPSERKTFAEHIWQTGVLESEELVIATKRDRVVRPFEFVLIHMPTTGINRLPGGAMLQGITYGYFRADSPGYVSVSGPHCDGAIWPHPDCLTVE